MTNPVYYTDNYPRVGCVIGIDVQASGYAFSITAPGGKAIEFNHAKNERALCRMIEEWCRGFVPRSINRLDQFSCGSSVTQPHHRKAD